MACRPLNAGGLIRGEELDRVPCLQFILGHTAVACGKPIAKIYDEARVSMDCQRHAMEMYGYDGLILHGWANAGGAELAARSSTHIVSTLAPP